MNIAYQVCTLLSLCVCVHRYEGDLSCQKGSFYLPNSGILTPAIKEDTSQLSTVIKMGWLDKNPPQGYSNDNNRHTTEVLLSKNKIKEII